MWIVFILFLFGLMGKLYIGFYVILGICIYMYIYMIFCIIKKKNMRDVLKNTFTPAFFLFLALFIVLSFLNRGKLADQWDEFSYWANVVKSMTAADQLSTSSALSTIAFRNYPPGMPLFQYFFQKISLLVHPEIVFSEWRLYFAYQIFAISFVFPHLSKLKFKRHVIGMLLSIVLFAAPLLLFPNFYTEVLIDPALGILAGSAFALILVQRKKDIFYQSYILMTAAALVLFKDVGTVLAIGIVLAFLLDEIWCQTEQKGLRPKMTKRAFKLFAMGCISITLPKLLWNLSVKLSGAATRFSEPVVLTELIRVIFHQDTTYRATVQENFFNALFTKKLTLGDTGISIPYLLILPLMMMGIFSLYKLYRQIYPRRQRLYKMLFWILLIESCIYIFGLFVIYLFRFSEYEAVRLASFERYIHIQYLTVWMFIILLAVHLILNNSLVDGRRNIMILCAAVMLVTPWSNTSEFISRKSVEDSIAFRRPYTSFNIAVQKVVDNKSPATIYFISQQTSGLDYWVMRYSLWPNALNDSFTWSIGQPFYDGDIWTKNITARQWQDELVSQYDYVAIYQFNNYFVQHFSSVFANPEDIHEKGIYKVNKQTKLLELCD